MLIEHKGHDYTGFLAALIRRRETGKYLEIGVSQGANLAQVECPVVIGVDPHFDLNINVMRGKKQLYLYQCSSDTFFRDVNLVDIAPGGIDLAFLDGMHVFEFLLRDFYNTEHVCHRGSVIAMHDCLPLNLEMVERVHNPTARNDKNFENWWTGDVWKVVAILKKYRPDLRVTPVNCPPTGLVLVSNLDPKSTVLEDHYTQIVTEFRFIADEEKALREMYDTLELIESAAILKDHDHTLYFKI